MERTTFFVAFCVALIPAITLANQKKIVLKVNLADGQVGDFLGEESVFDMDADGYAKQNFRGLIQQTDQPELFQKQRFSRDHDFMIRAPVPDGVYSVTLLMAETYEPACQPGSRVFDISLGTPHSGMTTSLPDFDLFANAGCQTAFGKRFDNIISKDGIVIRLGHKKQHPVLAGFIVEGFPVSKGDGKEYEAIGQVTEEKPSGLLSSSLALGSGGEDVGGSSSASRKETMGSSAGTEDLDGGANAAFGVSPGAGRGMGTGNGMGTGVGLGQGTGMGATQGMGAGSGFGTGHLGDPSSAFGGGQSMDQVAPKRRRLLANGRRRTRRSRRGRASRSGHGSGMPRGASFDSTYSDEEFHRY